LTITGQSNQIVMSRRIEKGFCVRIIIREAIEKMTPIQRIEKRNSERVNFWLGH